MTDSSGQHRAAWIGDSVEESYPSGPNEAPRAETWSAPSTWYRSGKRKNQPIPLITYAQISSLSEQVSLPVVDIIRALVRHAGNGEAAREMLELERVELHESPALRIG
ncbi:MAG: hypothetical protein ABIS07_18440 [Dokdonella sp.]